MKQGIPHYVSKKDIEELAALTAPTPENELQRIKVLRETNILNTNREEINLDCFTTLASSIFKVLR